MEEISLFDKDFDDFVRLEYLKDFFRVIEEESNRTKNKKRAEEVATKFCLAPLVVVRNLRAFWIKFESRAIFDLKISDDDDTDRLFTSNDYDLRLRHLQELVKSNEMEIFNMSKEEAETILANHKSVVQKNREFIVQHEVDILAWFSNKIKEFNIFEPVSTNMCV